MAIDFDQSRWEKIKADARAWWAGELDRPLIHYYLDGRAPGRPEPRLPKLPRGVAQYDTSITPEDIVDRFDYDLSCQQFLGDAFPHVFPNFGPGVLSTVFGATATPAEGTVWFCPETEKEVQDLHFRYDPCSQWMQRIKSIGRCAAERWQGQVQVSVPDLGNNLDILSTFRPGEKLLLDLYDHPEEVKRLTWEAHEAWWEAYSDITNAMRPPNPGYTMWLPIFSEVPYYMLTCDFCYMISTPMFDEFAKPAIADACRRLGNAFYHVDGPGQLPHLDSLLEIKELKGIQWIPAPNTPGMEHWPDLYRRIRKAGKRIQIWGNQATLDILTDQLGSAEGIIIIIGDSVDNADRARACLRKYGALG